MEKAQCLPLKHRTDAGTAIDSAGCLVLAQIEYCRTAVFECDEAVDHIDLGYVLGEAIDNCSKTLHASLRDSRTRSEAFT